jgi:hypothetical protein
MKILLLAILYSTFTYADGLDLNSKNSDYSPKKVIKYSAKYKKDTCLLFKKNNETFWERTETKAYKIIDTGKKYYKVKSIVFTNKGNWYLGKLSAINFNIQTSFYKHKCPAIEKKLSQREINELDSNK